MNNIEPVSKTELMDLLVTLNSIDQKLYKFLNPYKRYPEQNSGWFFLDYYNVLNAVYYEFCGQSQTDCYKQFKTCIYDREDKPIAWYKGEFSTKDDGSIKGPKGYKCFIPDCINDVILDYNLKPAEKLKFLTRMFKDLEKLKKAYEESKVL